MKKYTIRKAKRIGIITRTDKKGVICDGDEDMEVSDGYHTMDELYDHRVELFIQLCRILRRDQVENGVRENDEIWRSRQQADGSSYEGWFLLGIGKAKGHQLSYHIPLSRWDEVSFVSARETLSKAPEFDGHEPKDVLLRLKNL